MYIYLKVPEPIQSIIYYHYLISIHQGSFSTHYFREYIEQTVQNRKIQFFQLNCIKN